MNPRIKTPVEMAIDILMAPLKIGGAIAEGISNIARGRGLPRREHTPWGTYKQTMTTKELEDMNMY